MGIGKDQTQETESFHRHTAALAKTGSTGLETLKLPANLGQNFFVCPCTAASLPVLKSASDGKRQSGI